MRLDDLFPLIVIALIILVSLLKALFRALSSAQKGQPTQGRPSVWEEFKKALQDLAEEQSGRRRGQPTEMEEEELTEAEPSIEIEEETGEGGRQVILIAGTRRPRRRREEMARQIALEPTPPVGAETPRRPHRPEDLGKTIEEEVKDIVHRPVVDHLKQRGLAAEPAPSPTTYQAPALAALVRLTEANRTELQRAILLQEILSSPLADRPPGPGWINR